MLNQLVHNGVLVPDPPEYRELTLTIRGRPVRLAPKQEEMALAWAKKQGTPYVEDRTFVRNFLGDFSQELGLEEPLRLDEVDFGPAIRVVEEEKAARERLTKEERKAKAAERKARREELREQYGYAIVNGERVELANFTVEPSSIFMGRGAHPLRGRWKEGARQCDVTLNLSPDAPRPAGDWADTVWQPEALWVASWRDKLSGELKYVWLADTAPIKQSRDALKFDKAHDLHAQIEVVRAQIQQDLTDSRPRKRMLATACYLIDALCLRVGDEKDPDEADTVGATTLRPEHLTLHPDGVGEFRFLGKDSVLWHKKLPLPDAVRTNLEDLSRNARPSRTSRNGKSHPTRDKPQLFPDIGSQHVNAYLSRIMPGLTAKVFRTHHATVTVQESLVSSGVQEADPDYRKWEAVSESNLRAAELCNHYKQAPKSWKSSRERFQERIKKAEARVQKARREVKALEGALAQVRQEAREAKEAASETQRKRVATRYEKRIATAKRKLETARERLQRALLAHGKLRAQAAIASKRRTWNLQTSLKSYIDPRVYHRWGESVGYDVLASYYPKTLQRRFSWAREGEGAEDVEDVDS
jgi:DNA topoisomerase-1